MEMEYARDPEYFHRQEAFRKHQAITVLEHVSNLYTKNIVLVSLQT